MVKKSIPYPDLDTPSVLVDMDKMEANMNEAQQMANSVGIKIRPHSKSHECVDIVKMQIKAGAIGVSSAKVEEATHMAEGGIKDIQIVHPMYGNHKLEKLKKLLSMPGVKVTCTVDMVEHAEALSSVAQALGITIPVLLKIDTGVKRFGSLPGTPALKRAKEIAKVPGVKIVGIMGHESTHGERTPEGVDRICREVPALMAATARLLRNNGIQIKHVEVGSTPSLRNVPLLKDYPEVTEIHPGMYLFGDMMYVNNFAMPEDRVSLTVLATVIGISFNPPVRATIDAGGKTFSPEVLLHLRNEPGYFLDSRPRLGRVKGRPDLWFGRLPAENGILYFTDLNKTLSLGERVEVIPNNASMVVTLHDEIYGVRNGKVEKVFKIGRGLGN